MDKLPLDLEAKLRTEAATEADVLAYLEHRSRNITDAGGVAMPIDAYWAPGDLDRYRMAKAIWVKDAPPRFTLDLPVLLNGIAGPVGMPLTSFMHDLTHLWEQYAAWMHSEGRDPYHPEDTGRQSGARRARESMARTRARRAGNTDPEIKQRLEDAKRLHDEYLAACRARKEALAELDQAVRDAWAAYELARDAAKA